MAFFRGFISKVCRKNKVSQGINKKRPLAAGGKKDKIALVKADIINQRQTNFDYKSVHDNIFDKVFRGVYLKEIEHFDVGQIKKEAEDYCREKRIACSDDEKWLECSS